MSAPTVFLSAVTNDFGLPFLEELRRTIQHPGIACRFRGNLEQGGKILPEKLHGEIKAASCVIHLVGPGFGFGPLDVMLPDLERTPAGEYWKPACQSWWPLGDFPARRSYTQMELDFALQLGRPVYVIFLDDPALLAPATQTPEETRLQQAHRTAIETRGHERVRTDSISKLDCLIAKLPLITDHLRGVIATLHQEKTNLSDMLDKEVIPGIKNLPVAPPFDLDGYARVLQRHCLRIPLTDDFGSSGMERLTLREVFVEPYVRFLPLREPKDIELPSDIRDAALRGETAHLPVAERAKAERYQQLHREQSREPAIDLINAKEWRGYIILGDAGLGKTSLVRHLALTWADEWVKSQGQHVIGRIPLYIELKSYAAATGQRIEFTLLGYLQRSPHSVFNLPEHDCLRALTAGRALLILDALDEVADAAIQQAIARQAHELALKGAFIVVTSRASGFEKSHWPDEETWSCWMLEEFEKEEREEFLAKAAPLLWTSETDRTQRLADLRRRIDAFPAIERLTRNPLLLTLIVLMHRSNRLGESRVAIYDEASKWLLDRWEALRQTGHALSVPAITKRRIVRHLARRVYESNLASHLGENLFPLSLLQEVIREIADPQGADPVKADQWAELLPRILRERHSVLCYVGGQPGTPERDFYAFVHRSFLEFFAAEAWATEKDLAGLPPEQVRSGLLEASDPGQPPRWQDPRYENVLPLYFGLLADDRAAERLPLLLGLGGTGESGPAVLLAADCFSEVQDRSQHPDFAQDLEKRLIALAEAEWSDAGTTSKGDEANRELRRRAVRSITRLFADSQNAHPWLWRELGNQNRNLVVRQEIIRQLSLLLGKHEELRTRLENLIRPEEKDYNLRVQAIEKLAQMWPQAEWLRELLVEIIRSEEEMGLVRGQAIRTLGEAWPQAEWLRELLVALARPEEKDDFVRRRAIETLGKVWPQAEWLRELLVALTRPEEKDRYMRVLAIEELAQMWPQAEWLRELLVVLIRPEEKVLDVRLAVIEKLGEMWKQAEWLRELLQEISSHAGEHSPIANFAFDLLCRLWPEGR